MPKKPDFGSHGDRQVLKRKKNNTKLGQKLGAGLKSDQVQRIMVAKKRGQDTPRDYHTRVPGYKGGSFVFVYTFRIQVSYSK